MSVLVVLGDRGVEVNISGWTAVTNFEKNDPNSLRFNRRSTVRKLQVPLDCCKKNRHCYA